MKEITRLENLAKRNSLSRETVEKKSRLIEERLFGLEEFQKARAVMLYYGVKNEVGTKALIESCLKAGKRIALPVTDFGKNTMKAVEVFSIAGLEETSHGLVEPKAGKEFRTEDLDLVVLPGVAFDTSGNRIGMGKGFYDGLLRKTGTRVKLVGLCFEENIEESIPNKSHDIRVDIVVTDKKVVRCRQ